MKRKLSATTLALMLLVNSVSVISTEAYEQESENSYMAVHADTTIRGDVNADGEFTIADIVALQEWLLAVPDASLVDWKAGDLCEDQKLDVFDLCIMRCELISETPKNYIDVSTIDELFIAMREAKPGDVIRAAGGIYDYTTYQGAQKIDTSAERYFAKSDIS